MKLELVLALLLLGGAGCASAPAKNASASLELRVVEFADHPDPNTGVPHVVNATQPWPMELRALSAAAAGWSEKRGLYAYDIRNSGLTTTTTLQLEETTAQVLDAKNDSARISIHMDGAKEAIEVSVPVNGTVVLGSDRADDRHAFVAVSIFDRALASQIPEVFSTRDPSVTPPKQLTSSPLPITESAREHNLRGAVFIAEIDEQGNVADVHAELGRFRSPIDEKRLEDIARTWKFSPATRDGKPVRALTSVMGYFGGS
jgi:hypothetical protein